MEVKVVKISLQLIGRFKDSSDRSTIKIQDLIQKHK